MSASRGDPWRVGIVGCGVISAVYAEAGERFTDIEIVGCADVDTARAAELGQRHGLRSYDHVGELLDDQDVDAVLNLTPPKSHAELSIAALLAGKAVYSEKPLATTCTDARAVLDLAATKGLGVGCAPDTFLGAGLQSCRELIDAGAIGTPVAATAFVLGRGPDHWHPSPQFFYEHGAGPLLDMGPYYVTALAHLLGPVATVTGSARISRAQRLVRSGPAAGTTIEVETPTHVTGVLEMASGPLVTIAASFDVQASEHPRIEIYGSERTLAVPDPNRFGGPVRLSTRDGEWEEIPLTRPYAEQSRGLGLADLAAALRSGRAPRASGGLAYHVLDVLQSVLVSAADGIRRSVTSTATRPAPLPKDLVEGEPIR
ncbi:MAG: Gfo/Idh/MocA family protein [Acidimicrobiales bacterium]